MQPADITNNICLHLKHCKSLVDCYARQHLTLAYCCNFACLRFTPDSIDCRSKTLLGICCITQCRNTLWRIGNNHCTLLYHLPQLLQSLWQHSFGIGNPHHTITQALGSYNLAILYRQAIEQNIGVAVIVLISCWEWMVLVGTMSNLITQIPQHIRHMVTTLQHIRATSEIGRKLLHMLPPCLTSQERSTNACAERCAWLLVVNLWVVGICMEYGMGYTLYCVEIGNLLQHIPSLVPG